MTTVNDARRMLRHMLATLAYRTQKALRGAPEQFGEFDAGHGVRTPHELVRHMTQVLGSARSKLRGGTFSPERLPTFAEEVARLHQVLEALHADLGDPALHARISSGAPVQAENFIHAAVRTDDVSQRQPDPVAPDDRWRPDGTRAPAGEGQPRTEGAR